MTKRKKSRNTRPLLTPHDRRTLEFMRMSMRDDRNRQMTNTWEGNYEEAERLCLRLIEGEVVK